MNSNLKWRLGFGWLSILFFIGLLFGSVYFEGVVRGILGTLSLFMLFHLIFQYQKWNGSNWGKLHYRGMLLYSRFAGEEAAIAQKKDEGFNIKKACRRLGIAMCGVDSGIFIDAMIDELYKEQGEYCSKILRKYQKKVLPNIESTTFIEAANKINFGPQLVICNIIENTYGGEEAANYVLALLNGKAH